MYIHDISSNVKIREIYPCNPALRREVRSFEVYTVLCLATGQGIIDVKKISDLTEFLTGWRIDPESIESTPLGVSPEAHARGALENNNKELISELLDEMPNDLRYLSPFVVDEHFNTVVSKIGETVEVVSVRSAHSELWR